LGTQPDSGFGAKRKLVLFWELPYERGTFDGKEFPLGISKFYALSLNKKANLRKDLASWRGRDFTADELKGFELKNVLGKACQLSIEHNEDGRARVSAVIGVPKGMQVPPPWNPLVEYSIEDGKNEVYAKLPEWVRDMCDHCLEWQPKEAEATRAGIQTDEGQAVDPNMPPPDDTGTPF